VSIEIYTGMQGAGKTYCMVKEVILPCLRSPHFRVISNLDVTDQKTGKRTERIDLSEGFKGLQRVIEENLALPRSEMRDMCIAVDELGVAMPSEMWKGDAAMEVVALSLQMRKSRCDLIGTVQHFERTVKVLRDNVNLVHKSRLYWRHPWHRDVGGPINRRTGRPYKRPWFFEVETVLPEVVNLSEEGRKRGRMEWRKVIFDMKVAKSYDTYQRIAPLKVMTTPSRRGGADLDDVEELVDERAREWAVAAVQADREASGRGRRTR
jgi:hypothetical protein